MQFEPNNIEIENLANRFSMESTPIVFGFNVADYVIFISLLVLSTLIGIYYGFVAKKKQDNTAEYLFGGKEMTLIPIAISLIVQYVILTIK